MTLFFFHVPKVACNATTCSGQGICTDDGVCLCDNGFYADNCSSKFLDLHYLIIISVPETQPIFVFSMIILKKTLSFNYNLVSCDPSTKCKGHGLCGNNGTCQCSGDYYGDSCSSKIITFNWYKSKYLL